MTLPILILPSWRYHATQGGKIFRTREELAEAEAEGWRDSPGAAVLAAVEALPVVDIDWAPIAHVGGFDHAAPAEPTPDDGVAEKSVVAKKRRGK